MKRNQEGLHQKVDLVPATLDQEPILANLLELYIHDFTKFLNIDIGPDGRFGYKHLPLYWTEPNRHPFLIQINGKLAGFVLVKQESAVSDKETVWDMAEFFILHGYRRRGIGTEVAHKVWKLFPGHWQVRVMEANVQAHQFWSRAISSFTCRPISSVKIEKDGQRWHIFSFESGRAI
jgi:predicted acetyltransferase